MCHDALIDLCRQRRRDGFCFSGIKLLTTSKSDDHSDDISQAALDALQDLGVSVIRMPRDKNYYDCDWWDTALDRPAYYYFCEHGDCPGLSF